jgi:A/G-specific adenine glycosylase
VTRRQGCLRFDNRGHEIIYVFACRRFWVSTVGMNPETIVPLILRWFVRNARELPWRRTSDPYGIWVSEIMLQQTQVKTVIPYWERWMRTLPTIKALARAKPEKLHKLWEGLGYYTRVRNMQKAAQAILKNYDGKFPSSFEDILELPGIGRYTAGAICSIAFHQPRPAVDGNVIRVLTRVFGIAGNPRDKNVSATLWRLAEQLVRRAVSIAPNFGAAAPSSNTGRSARLTGRLLRGASSLNEALMELGALVCTPRRPRCEACPLAGLCEAFQGNRIGELPSVPPRPAAIPRCFAAFIVKRRGKFLVRQRAEGAVNAHLWEFPNVEVAPDSADPKKAARKALGVTPRTLKRLCSIRHTITRYRITLDAYCATGAKRVEKQNGFRWLKRAELNRLAFTSAHGTVLRRWIRGATRRGWIGG